jgi:hypothetical protein
MVSWTRVVAATSAAIVLASGLASGKSAFRLEVGPPVAAGFKTGKKTPLAFAARALDCNDVERVTVTARAEGLMNGSRQSLPLSLVEYATPGVFGVPHEWPNGVWVVSLTATCPSPPATAGAIVRIGMKGSIRSASTILPRRATPRELDEALRQLAGTTE